MKTKTHIFETSGLGKAPYTFKGVTRKVFDIPGVARLGGYCDYCNTPIVNCFHLISADGKEFIVGCECVRMADDAGLMEIVKKEESKMRREKAIAKYAETKAKLEAIIQNNLNALANKPHPSAQGLTLLDYAQWMLTNAKQTGIMKLYKMLIKELSIVE